MVVLLTFLIVSVIFWLSPKLRTVDIVIASVVIILMTLYYVGSVFTQYMIEFMKYLTNYPLLVNRERVKRIEYGRNYLFWNEWVDTGKL